MDYVQCLKHPVYLPTWIAEVLKQLGSWFTTIAIVSQLNRDTADPSLYVGLFLLSRRLPYLFTFPITGAAADAFNRGAILACSCALQGCISLAFIFVDMKSCLWLLFALAVVQTCLQSFYDPARAAAIPTLFPPDEAYVAATLDTFCWCFTAVAGGLLGGATASRFGSSLCFLIDASCLMSGALFMLRLVSADAKRLQHLKAAAAAAAAACRDAGTEPRDVPRKEQLLFGQAGLQHYKDADIRAPLLQCSADEDAVGCSSDDADVALAAAPLLEVCAAEGNVLVPHAAAATMLQGFKYLLARCNTDVLIIIFAKASGALVWGAVDVYNSRISQLSEFHSFGDASVTYGILLGVTGFGCLTGPTVANIVVPPKPAAWRFSIAMTFVLQGSGLAMLAFARNIWTVMATAFLRSCGSNTLWTHSTAILQLRVPDTVLGRVFASEFMLYTLSEGGTAFLAGWALDRWSLPMRNCCLALASASGVLWVLWTLNAWCFRRQRHHVPELLHMETCASASDGHV